MVARLVQELLIGGPGERHGEWRTGGARAEMARLGGGLDGDWSAMSSIQVVAPAESYAAVVEILAGVVLEPDLSSEEWSVGDGGSRLRETGGAEPDRDRAKSRGCWERRDRRTIRTQLTTESVAAFYRRYYQPRNLVVTVVGDIFSLPALGQIQLKFGALSGTESEPGRGWSPGAGRRSRECCSTATARGQHRAERGNDRVPTALRHRAGREQGDRGGTEGAGGA
jgi:hypothetical protein